MLKQLAAYLNFTASPSTLHFDAVVCSLGPQQQACRPCPGLMHARLAHRLGRAGRTLTNELGDVRRIVIELDLEHFGDLSCGTPVVLSHVT